MTRADTTVEPTTQWRAAWAAELDRLEMSLESAEALLRSPHAWLLHGGQRGDRGCWQPQVRGVLPEDLLPRARLIHERQLAVARALAERALSTHRQNELARIIRESTCPPEVPVYVDVSY